MTFKDGYILKDDKAQTVSPWFIMKFANKSIRLMILLIVVAFQCSSAFAVPDEIEESLKYAQGLSRAFSYVSEKIRPSIVTISSVKHARQSSFQAPPQQFQNGQLRDFFRDHLVKVRQNKEWARV